MTETAKDGGPAFPFQANDRSNLDMQTNGMSLRDWFAGQALAGLLAGSPDADCGPMGYASDAYSMADAMLIARATGEKEAKE